jgi:hypothetical protein
MKPEFLNVDLEVVTGADPTPLAKALGRRANVLYCGKRKQRDYLAAFEFILMRSSPERRLAKFCDLLETLPPPAARIWKQARSRTFDIGVMSGEERPALVLCIPPKTLARVTALGAGIAITVYPSDS